MESTVTEEIRRTFDLAALRREAASIRTPRLWEDVVDIKRRCQAARTKEKDLYVTRYDSRVETVRRRLVDEAGVITRDFRPGWAGEDNFSPDTTLRQAEREVRERHHSRIGRIDEYERQGLREVVRESMQLNNLEGQAREAFGRATDRRVGPERRGRQRDRD